MNLAPSPQLFTRAIMEEGALRALIQAKLADGRLPGSISSRLSGWPGSGETCDACDETVVKPVLAIETRSVQDDHVILFHAFCFYVWHQVREGTRP
jgi:hypothetical protein